MRLDRTDPIGAAFAGLAGKPGWNVRRGHGSFLTFEFGVPRLEIREPMPEAKHPLRRRRLATVRGDWHLWIYCCNWRVVDDDELISDSNGTDQELARAAAKLDGQIIEDVQVDPATGTSRFSFDLGGVMETWPDADEPEGHLYEQWYLYCPDEMVLSWRADGLYSWQKSDTPPDQEIWLPLPER